jgi:hypothetical protein
VCVLREEKSKNGLRRKGNMSVREWAGEGVAKEHEKKPKKPKM